MYGNNNRGGGHRSGGFGDRRPNMSSPVNVGEVLDVIIEAVGEKGDGIAKKQGFVLFIPGAKEGQNVKVKITKVLRKVGFAEIVGEGSAPLPEQAEDTGSDADSDADSKNEDVSEPIPKPAQEDSEDFGEEPAEEPEDESEDNKEE